MWIIAFNLAWNKSVDSRSILFDVGIVFSYFSSFQCFVCLDCFVSRFNDVIYSSKGRE